MTLVTEIRPLHVANTHGEGATGPVYAYALFHPDGLILVDTGMIDHHPEIDEVFRPTLRPLPEHRLPLDQVMRVINTHLHFDHCGGNRLFPGVPISVQRAEREAAREPDYTIPEWVEFEGAAYDELDGPAEIVPGVRVLPTPGHAAGQIGGRGLALPPILNPYALFGLRGSSAGRVRAPSALCTLSRCPTR